TVTLLGTPARWKERLNAGLAIYAQDAWTLGRITITYGLRWGYVSEQVSGQPAQHGRFANIPAFGDIYVPIWRTWSPRTAVVYDGTVECFQCQLHTRDGVQSNRWPRDHDVRSDFHSRSAIGG